MSAGATFDTATFDEDEREQMVAEIRPYLAWHLQHVVRERYDPVRAVEELTGLTAGELARTVAAHVCLSTTTARFCSALPTALRAPFSATEARTVMTHVVRGRVDWPQTFRLRASAGGAPGRYAVRPQRRIPDVVENQTLAWALHELDRHATVAAKSSGKPADWQRRILTVQETVARARAADWLHGVAPRRPDGRTLARLAATRSPLYGVHLPRLAHDLLGAVGTDPVRLTDLLCERCFVPSQGWLLYELLVALRVARAFSAALGPPLARRLLTGTSQRPFAEYQLAGGDEIAIFRGGWPSDAPRSTREASAARHRLPVAAAKPDLVLVRRGRRPDCVMLELKASRRAATLADGVDQLLRYLADQPQLFRRRPAGWLVAPQPNEAFERTAQDRCEPLWITGADDVALAAVARMVC